MAHSGHQQPLAESPHANFKPDVAPDVMKGLEVVVEQPAVPTGAFKLWRPGVKDKLRHFVLAPNFQLGVQLALGMFVIALFRFVPALWFPQSCVAATLFLVSTVMMAADNHVGTRLTAAASLIGPTSLGAVFGGCLASLAKLAGPGDSYTAILCVLGVLGLALLTINKVGPNPPYLPVLGMVSCLGFGIILITGRTIFPIPAFWHISVGYFILALCLAGGVAVLVSVLVLPSLASDEVTGNVSKVLRSAGHITSNYAARLFMPPTAIPPMPSIHNPHSSYSLGHGDVSRTVQVSEGVYMVDETADEAEVLEWLHHVTQPPPFPAKGDQGPGKVPPLGARTFAAEVRPISSLRPLIARTRMVLNAARMDPPFMRSHDFNPQAWECVVSATERLITRISALESVLQDGVYVNENGPWSPELIATFRVTYAQIAAALQRLSHGAGSPQRHKLFCIHPLLFGRGWEATKKDLAESVVGCLAGYWGRIRSKDVNQPAKMVSSIEVRSVMFTWSLTQNIVIATEALEQAAVAAICGTAPQPTSEAAGPTTASTTSHEIKSWVLHNFGWLLALGKLLLSMPMLHNLYNTLTKQLPLALSSKKAFAAMLRGRMFQAGVKFWFMSSVLLVVTISIMATFPEAQLLNPFFGYITALLSMSDKVEATVSKVSFWLVGTATGGSLGLLSMAFVPFATNPYGHMVVLCVFCFIVGQLGQTQFRVVITLTLMTYGALVLCQYRGCCDATGDIGYFLARVLSVYMGVIFAATVNNLVLPWYTSTWALDTLGATFKRSTSVLAQFYAQFRDIGFAASVHYKQAHPELQKLLMQYEANILDAGNGGGAMLLQAQSPDNASMHPGASAAAAVLPVQAPAAAATSTFAATASAVPGLPPSLLQEAIAAPLVAVQAVLARDTVLWQRGVLATPKVVHTMLRSMLSLLDRMAAMQMTIAGAQVLGHHTGALYDLFVEPLHAEWAASYETVQRIADAVAVHVHAPRPETAAAINKLIDTFEHQRVHLRAHSIDMRRRTTAAIANAQADELHYLLSADDLVSIMSFTFAHIKVFDAVTVVARCVVEAGCQQRSGTTSWFK